MVPNPNVNPAFVYKIADAPPPTPIPETLPLSELDQKDGFIHLSDAKQIPITANLFFKDSPQLWILKVSTADMGSKLDWPDELTGCAHLFDGSLGKHNVFDVKSWHRQDEKGWDTLLVDDWLE
ncbi:hypothetical protein NA57DRAFT_80163 [Rhizodiscina lignyota]|uniref:DUF952 domain-containing protein n=1 Tax=Rhizodiscina lignyota TaxID=1504668 RepID=A0A9P4I7X1_9PEZI|nr:hypothetical protein NA57DRAFT_80163 [Rhizodiscina lignyota]